MEINKELIKDSKYDKYIGSEYGRLKVIRIYNDEKIYKGKRYRYKICECRCSCGEVVEVRLMHLKSGRTRSCGCLKRDWDKSKKNEGNKYNEWIKEAYKRVENKEISITELSKESGVSRQTIYKYIDRIKRGEM